MGVSLTYQDGGLDAEHTYPCAYCGESNNVFVESSATWFFDPAGAQRQHMTQECEACLETNTLTVTVNRQGSVRVFAEKTLDENQTG